MTPRDPIVFAAVLAAGRSSRFGTTKQLASLHGVPLVRRAAAAAARVCGGRVVTVLGHDCDSVLAALTGYRGFVVVNDDYRRGIGASIACAARACRPGADAMLLVFADQPLVTAEHLQALITNWSGADDEIVAAAYRDIHGPPVLFPRGAFDKLGRLDGDTGARALLRDPAFRVKSVPCEEAAVDVNTPDDLAALA